jgi:hypothetical protein
MNCLADVLHNMGYFQCKADPNLWIKEVAPIINMFLFMSMIICALALICNASTRLSLRHIILSWKVLMNLLSSRRWLLSWPRWYLNTGSNFLCRESGYQLWGHVWNKAHWIFFAYDCKGPYRTQLNPRVGWEWYQTILVPHWRIAITDILASSMLSLQCLDTKLHQD